MGIQLGKDTVERPAALDTEAHTRLGVDRYGDGHTRCKALRQPLSFSVPQRTFVNNQSFKRRNGSRTIRSSTSDAEPFLVEAHFALSRCYYRPESSL